MTTTYAWPEMRDRAIALFNGDTPGAELENTILTHFREHPGRVHTLIDAIGRKVAQGQVKSGWAILGRELTAIPENIQATDDAERELRLELAKTWIKNTGGYIDRESELGYALFVEGPLADWPELWHQIAATWREERDRFAAQEAADLERQREQGETYHRLRKASRGAPNPDEHAALVDAEVQRAHLAYLATIAPDEGAHDGAPDHE